MNQRKKKAFTLTELLVVVVIIGVLAAVILPKFNKVMETRKTTEVEELMAAVRTEQEYRCAIDKPYIGDMEKLSDIIPNASTKNFNYSLETTGMLASSKGKYSYELKMPSYADGRVCCEGAGCTQLNKDYPTCAELQTKPDYQVSTECTATLPAPPTPLTCNGVRPNDTEICNDCGSRSRSVTCNLTTQEWKTGNWSACSKTQEECTSVGDECDEADQVLREACEEGCGWKTREVTGCENGQWKYTDWNDTCRGAETETYDCATYEPGKGGTKTRTEVCNQETGEWYYPEEWEGECKQKRWLSPLSFCATANHEDKEKGKERPGYCRTLLLTRSCATNNGHYWGDSASGDEKYGIYNCSANNEKVLSFLERVSQYQHVATLPSGCSFGGQCDECDPSKKYYDLENSFCETCWAHGLLNEEHTVAGRCDTMYRIPYAICKEAAENPFECYPTVNCKKANWQSGNGANVQLQVHGDEWGPIWNNLPCRPQ